MSASAPHGEVFNLTGPWPGLAPFLFANHHLDHYPAGTAQMAPVESVADRPLGRDFGNPAGWNMYHGQSVPGFPAHPHRGFETITIVRSGWVDHADSLGATARFGAGDVQWLTAGSGIVHSEMFPLVSTEHANPLELFQIWLNLPAAAKQVEPDFHMYWSADIPKIRSIGPDGGAATVTVITGDYTTRRDTGAGVDAPAPPPRSLAADPAAGIAVWLVDLAPDAEVELPAAPVPGTRRVLYAYGAHTRAQIEDSVVTTGQGYACLGDDPTLVVTEDRPAQLLMLQALPLDEPVAARGPFVMNTEPELAQAFADYQRTGFGGWPWDRPDVVHPREAGRFARHADGRTEQPER